MVLVFAVRDHECDDGVFCVWAVDELSGLDLKQGCSVGKGAEGIKGS